MLTSTAITDSIPINAEDGYQDAIGPRDFCGIVVLSQGGMAIYTTDFVQVLRTTNSVSPGGEPLRIQYQSDTDKLQVRVQDSTTPLSAIALTSDTLGHNVDDSILLAAFSWNNATETIDVWARTLGGTKRSGTATGGGSFAGVPEPTGLIIGKGSSTANAYIGSYAVALGTGTLTSGNFDDIYTAFSTSPVWGSLKEFATLASAVTWHVGFPITTGSGT